MPDTNASARFKRLAATAILLQVGLLSPSGSQASSAPEPGREGGKGPLAVAILLFDGVEIIDYSGPWEVFGQAGYKVFTVSETIHPVETVFGQRVIPEFTFEQSPAADILLIPGGNTPPEVYNNPKLLKWVKHEAGDAKCVLTVCTGAFIAANAGLLDGCTATTYHGSIDKLARFAPRTKVVRDKRFVDNGKMITTSGLSSGIDGALHVVSRFSGLGEAQGVALNLEYDWDPHSRYARAALADRLLQFPFNGISAKCLSQEGDREHWESRWLVSGEPSASKLEQKIGGALASQCKWVRQSAGTSGNPLESAWKFKDEAGGAWKGILSVRTAPDVQGAFVATLQIARD